MRFKPEGEWKGQPAIVVASGPSAASTPLERMRGRARFIAVNESWRLVPWADILFATDAAWWDDNKGLPEFQGRRFTASPKCAEKYGLELFFSIGTNSGLRAILLAASLGARPIYLVGFEMHHKSGIHWHAPFTRLRNPGPHQIRVWRDETELAAESLRRHDVSVINCTPGSALKRFKYLSFDEVVNGACGESSADHEGCAAAPA